MREADRPDGDGETVGRLASARLDRVAGLAIAVAIALGFAAANSPLGELYRGVHHLPVHAGFGDWSVRAPLIQWINQGLLVVFFTGVGLSTKRELMVGRLSSIRRASLPAAAALGGMALPAAIFVAANAADPVALRGWAIPVATDIVLATGLLALLGSAVPAELKVFLTALAVFDDIGAILVVALFFGDVEALSPLLVATAGGAVLLTLNVLRARRITPYVAAGALVWLGLLMSGIEAAIAGVAIGAAIPLAAREEPSSLRLAERRLTPWSLLVVAPLFGFFNAGVRIDALGWPDVLGSAPLGIVAGLAIGKPLGVLGACAIAMRLGIGSLPGGWRWPQLAGVAMFAGVGFTMSLFMASLAWSDPTRLASAKAAVLAGSMLSAGAGAITLMFSTARAGAGAGKGAGGQG